MFVQLAIYVDSDLSYRSFTNTVIRSIGPLRCPVEWIGDAAMQNYRDSLFLGCLLLSVGFLTSQQHAGVSQGQICPSQFDVMPH